MRRRVPASAPSAETDASSPSGPEVIGQYSLGNYPGPKLSWRWTAANQQGRTMTNLEVTEANYDDPIHALGIVDVLNSYAADPVGGAKPLTSEVRSRLVPALRDHPSSLVVLALAKGSPVGVAVCFFGLSTFQARPLLNVHDLAVVSTSRGHGVGRALLTAVERRALQRGCCKLTLEVQEDNIRARNLYGSFGFSDVVIGDSAPTRFLAKPLPSVGVAGPP